MKGINLRGTHTKLDKILSFLQSKSSFTECRGATCPTCFNDFKIGIDFSLDFFSHVTVISISEHACVSELINSTFGLPRSFST